MLKQISSTLTKHSPTILTIFGCAGVVTTAVFASKATIKAKELNLKIPSRKENKDENFTRVKDLAKVYWPTVMVGGMTIGCIILSNRINLKRNAALATAYTFASTTLSKYQDKVVEQFGKKKAKKVKEAVDEDQIANKPETIVISDEEGMTLCYDSFTGRYFKSDIETIRKAANDVNEELVKEGFVALNEFYERINLPTARIGEDLGWNINYDGQMELEYSSQLTDKKMPCLVISYQVEPKYYYDSQ